MSRLLSIGIYILHVSAFSDDQSCVVPESSSNPSYDQSTSSSPTVVRTKKRKLTVRSMETKYVAILEVEQGLKSKTQIAKEVGIPQNTLSTWLKRAEQIKAAYVEISSF